MTKVESAGYIVVLSTRFWMSVFLVGSNELMQFAISFLIWTIRLDMVVYKFCVGLNLAMRKFCAIRGPDKGM